MKKTPQPTVPAQMILKECVVSILNHLTIITKIPFFDIIYNLYSIRPENITGISCVAFSYY